ncbi:MAG: hypothetical protein GEU75_01940 [Dehalococcoidia bacterium]|nr:hypothetical protein [Dehalococcoidia bacterium]
MDVTAKIAQFINESAYDQMPRRVIDTAKSGILDCLAAALAGSTEESARICTELTAEEAGREEATIYGRDLRSSALGAAFANGTAAHGGDFDHSFVVGGQPTAPVIPATLALAEALGSSGKQVIEAYVTGFEVTANLALSMVAPAGDGWHANSVFGSFGAMAACARLLGLSREQSAMAIAITASMASGLTANFGTMTKPLHVGFAARNGMLAAKLAKAGFTANPEALETPKGFFDSFYPGRPLDEQQIDGLGQVFAMEKHGIRFKPYPCGGLTHTAIFATIKLCEDNSIAAEAIDSITVDVPRTTYTTISFPTPETTLQAKFCMPYLVARSVIDRTVTLDSFSEAAIRDEKTLALLKKVSMRADPALESARDGSRPATVAIRLLDGQAHELHARFPKGSAEVPMKAEELDAKFRACARGIISNDAREQALGYLRGLETLADIRTLAGLMKGT